MYMTHTNPWRLLDELNRSNLRTPLRQPVASSTGDWTPAVDILEEGDRFVIRADVPGIAPKDIQVQMEDGVLSIQGQRPYDSNAEDASYKRVERARGNFLRRFTMPESADAERITARSSHGVLEVSIPKLEKVQQRKIQVEE